MKNVEDLLKIMERLRDPDGGCPWDLEQTFATIAPHTLEEAYEVADAVRRGDMDDLRGELGDLLLQVVFHSQMAKEASHFDFNAVVDGIAAKLVHRHPHVFGNENAATAADVNVIWEQRKDAEKKNAPRNSVMDDIPLAIPALMRAQKLSKQAAKTGFEWEKPADVLIKLDEELEELREAVDSGIKEDIYDELGDVLFVITNYGRMLGLDSEEALRRANDKFERRFRGMEKDVANDGLTMNSLPLERMEEYWQKQKKKAGSSR